MHVVQYIPVRSDAVIGVVTNKGGDVFRIDIGASQQATLSYLAFEGVSKKNRPDVKVSTCLYSVWDKFLCFEQRIFFRYMYLL